MRRSLRALLVTSLVATALAIPTAAVLGPGAAGAASVPGGFTDSLVTTVSSPTAVVQLDTSRVVVLEKGGRVRIIKSGALLAAPALTKAVCSDSEMGFLGFAVDPAFAANHFVYLYWTRQKGTKCVNRVSRFTMTGDAINPASELVLLDNIAGTETESAGNHNGGDLQIPSDGYLYVSVGDSGSDPRNNSGSGGGNDAAQDASLLNGKILRITRTGAPVPGNPFYSGANATNCALLGVSAPATARCREILDAGLRNPFRMAFDPNSSTTRFFINDVGQSTREEVDLGRVGGNYGWPCREGTVAGTYRGSVCANTFVGPITDYGRSTGQFITGGAFVPNGAWPAGYDGGYLFADGGSGNIWLRAANGSINYAAPFATGAPGISHLSFVLESTGYSLYYVLNGSGEVRKITAALPASTATDSLAFVPIGSVRHYDTRTNTGAAGVGPVRANTSRLIAVAGAGPRAALVNITLANARSAGFVQVWSPRTLRSDTSVLNIPAAGASLSNSQIVPLDAGGRVMISTTATGDLIVDVLGLFSPAHQINGGRFRSLPPQRLGDTRARANAGSNPWTKVGDHFDFQVTGKAGVPGTGVSSVALMVTAVGHTSSGYVTAFPSGASRPATSNLNTSGVGDVRSNLVIVKVGANGKISLFGSGVAGIIVDVAGWFTSTGAPADGLFTALPPTRRVDTRMNLGFGSIPANGSRTVTIPGLPGEATAVVQNLTVVGTGGTGWLTASPNAGAVPSTSNVNWTGPNQTRAVQAVTQLPAGDSARYTALHGATGLLVDVLGYFT